MNKKILIGSIIAVAILVLVSFTGVVGYQTTKSSTIAKASPLFTVRSSRAIDEESKDIACDYVGKGKEINLVIPNEDISKFSIKDLFDILNEMDDITYNKFTDLLIKHLQQTRALKKSDIQLMMMKLHQLKSDSQVIKNEQNDLDFYTLNGGPWCTYFGIPLFCRLGEIMWSVFSDFLKLIILFLLILT